MGDQADGNGLDQHAGAESEHEADGTHLHTFVVVFGDQGGQGRIGDVVGCIKARVQQCVGDEEPCILCLGTHIRGNAEDRHQADRAAKIAVKHPGPSLAHLCIGLIDHGPEENIADAVKELGHRDQRADDTCVHAHGICQEDHDKSGQQRIHHVAGYVA